MPVDGKRWAGYLRVIPGLVAYPPSGVCSCVRAASLLVPLLEASLRWYRRSHTARDAVESPILQAARGRVVCLMIDGARMVTLGVLSLATAAFRAYRKPTISVLGWHLGPDLQNRSIAAGYDQAREDALLHGIAWPEDGYRLFDISVLAGSCKGGWFRPIAESNAVFLSKEAYLRLGGFDERFDCPGGGFVNLDFYRRAVLREDSELVLLLGEGTFHQIHGGVATNVSAQMHARNVGQWQAQYRALRGEDFRLPEKRPIYLGSLAPPALPSVAQAARNAVAKRV